MAIIPWRTKRQVFYFGIFALIILAIIGGLVWYFWPEPTCTDGRKNGEEEGIDCGGPCTPCLGEIKDISILWVSFFKNREGFYDAAAMIKNPNLSAGIPAIKYTFKLYDINNTLITVRENSTYINPDEKQVIFETGLPAGQRIPHSIRIELDGQKNWKYLKKERPFLSVVRRDFFNYPFPRLSAEIRNDSLFNEKNIFVAAVLYDGAGNVQGVGITKIDLIPAESSQIAYFSWPSTFEKEPASIEIIPSVNLTENNQ